MDRANPKDEYVVLEEKLRGGIEDYFKNKLNRPELLNRIGDNVVVFDYVREKVAVEILEKMVTNIIERISEGQKIQLSLSPAAKEFLVRVSTSDLGNGGRGIGNKLESYLINPLAREMYRIQAQMGAVLEIAEIGSDGAVPYVRLVTLTK